jgi:hypothetical protein
MVVGLAARSAQVSRESPAVRAKGFLVMPLPQSRLIAAEAQIRAALWAVRDNLLHRFAKPTI